MEAMEAQMEGDMAAMSSVDGHGAEGWFKRLKKRLKHGYGDSDDGRTPVIVDTDVDTDDQMAIAYLLAQPDFKVLAITVGCNGWSQQWAGVMSIMRLTKYFGQPRYPRGIFIPLQSGHTAESQRTKWIAGSHAPGGKG